MTTRIKANDNSRWHAVPTHLRFIIGQDQDGYWLAIETHGRGGGVLISRETALKYAGFETDHRRGVVNCTARQISLTGCYHAIRKMFAIFQSNPG